jgi:hypothetical protein
MLYMSMRGQAVALPAAGYWKPSVAARPLYSFGIWSDTLLVASYAAIVIGLWGLYGLLNGFNFETGLIYSSDVSPGFNGFFYSDPLRKFTSLFYHLSYLLGSILGIRGSFVPYQVVYGALWVLRCFLTYVVVRRLIPDRPALAVFAGAFVALHAADAALNWVGQLNQFGFIFLMLLSVTTLIVALDSRHTLIACAWTVAAAIFAYLSLWSYETPLPVMILFPAGIVLLRRDIPTRRFVWVTSVYLLPALAFVTDNARRYLTHVGSGSATYQAGVVRHDFSAGGLVSDLWLHVENALLPWHWPHAYFSSLHWHEYAIAAIPVTLAAAAVSLIGVARESIGKGPIKAFRPRRLLLFAAVSFGLLVASSTAVLLLADNRTLWRTEFLPSFPAACLLATVLYALLAVARTNGFRVATAVIVLMGVGTFSTFAGVNSALYFHSLWERQRVLISSIVSNAPSVPDGTLFIVRNIDRSEDPFGHNMWLDLALRLAYPGIRVGGIYLFDDNRPAPGMNIDIANGKPRVLPEGFQTLFHAVPESPINRVLVFDYDAKTGEAEPVGSGRIMIADKEFSVPSYSFCTAISGSKPDMVAIRRYGPIVATHRIVCPAGGHS